MKIGRSDSFRTAGEFKIVFKHLYPHSYGLIAKSLQKNLKYHSSTGLKIFFMASTRPVAKGIPLNRRTLKPTSGQSAPVCPRFQAA